MMLLLLDPAVVDGVNEGMGGEQVLIWKSE